MADGGPPGITVWRIVVVEDMMPQARNQQEKCAVYCRDSLVRAEKKRNTSAGTAIYAVTHATT